MADFLRLANDYGLPWAALVAVCVAYWLEVQDRKKNTVPLQLYTTLDGRTKEIAGNQASIIAAIEKVTLLVKIALFGSKGEEL